MSDESNPMLSVEVDDGVTVITVRRQTLTDEDNLEDLGQTLQGLISNDPAGQYVLDVSQLTYATSAVLGKWIAAHRSLGRSGGRLIVCGVGKELLEIIEATRLHKLFVLAPDKPSAIAMLKE